MKRLNIKPLSVNECWQGRRFKTPKYKSYSKELLLILPKQNIDFTKKLKLNIVFGFSSSASDIDNPLKPFIDNLQKFYNFNDKQIFELNIKKEKVVKGREYIDFEIKTL